MCNDKCEVGDWKFVMKVQSALSFCYKFMHRMVLCCTHPNYVMILGIAGYLKLYLHNVWV